MIETIKKTVCPLCEAGCGLSVKMADGDPVEVRGDEDDPSSLGYLCPKGVAILDLQRDPDRLRSPVRRNAQGGFDPISWKEAFELTATRLRQLQKQHGRDSVASYMGTPMVHKHNTLLMRGALLGALRTHNSTSAGSQDTSPRFVTSYWLYGSTLSTPIPDLARTDYLLCIGANPLVSNGSLLTAPDMRRRLRALQERGGKLVVIDPRRSETAHIADEHVAVVPGADAALLLAMVQVIVKAGLAQERWLEQHTRGFQEVAAAISDFTPERVAAVAGVPAEVIVRLAHEFASARSSVAYARIGICNNAYSTVASYAVDLLNAVAGRLGAAGGAVFPKPAIDLPRLSRLSGADGFARWKSRVRGLPETAGDVPASTLAEEMETVGTGQVRALVTFAGNPVLTVPNGQRLARALQKLDFMVSIDMYINETTRFADVILPPCGPLSDDHLDLFFANVAAHNLVRWTEAVVPKSEAEREDWEIMLELAFRLGGGPTGLTPVDALYRGARKLGHRFNPRSTLDMALRFGPHRLKGADVRAAPSGVDLGEVEPGMAHRIFHRHGRVDLAPGPILAAIRQLSASLSPLSDIGEMLLIGRRELRSNNSWMHNLPKLVSGKSRCSLLIHPRDAERLGVRDGDLVELESRVHRGQVPARISDEVRVGVVSLPHGYGHGPLAPYQKISAAVSGASFNDWTDDLQVEAVVGQSILNGIRVKVSSIAQGQRVSA